MHPDTNFRSRSGAATKWHETIQNMSFRPKVVEWACLLKKTRNGSRGTNSYIKCASIPVFATCQVRLQNGMEPPKTWVLDWNSGLGMFDATNKNWFRSHKLVHLMHPILNFTMGQVRQRNGVKPPETRVLEVKYVVRNRRDIVEHRNGVKISKLWVLYLKGAFKSVK